MCVQCKDLIGCSKSGCTQMPHATPCVADLLARARKTDEKNRPVLRNKARREVPTRTASAS